MTSYLEQVVENLGSIVPLMTAGLAEVREKDKHTRNLLKAIYNEEGELMEELKELTKTGPDFDEEPLKAKAQSLATRRQHAALQLEDQNKFAMSLYQKLDEKIKNFDISNKSIAHLFPDGFGNSAEGDLQRKKKKRKHTGRHGGQQDDIEGMESVMQYDSNEPTYCTCKRISFGSMIACDNTECVVEWFHYECVGLKEEPASWLCPTCREESSASAATQVAASLGSTEAKIKSDLSDDS